MNLKKLDFRISNLSRGAKKKLLAKFLILTNDNFIWLQETQKEISNIDSLIEIPQQEGDLFRALVRVAARSRRIQSS
jgi:hypothetical protein